MDLLTNAIESIRLGVEDFQSDTHPRLLSAVRNIHAGILLLYKESLRRLSPEDSNEALLKARAVPKRDVEGKVAFIGVGGKTVDVQQIKERFEGLGIATDWSRFDRINSIRNEIEHYYTKVTQQTLNGLIADAFVIVRSFIANELSGDARELLGNETWQIMLRVSEVYEAERAECERLLNAVNWQSRALERGVLSLTCPDCGSGLLRPESPDDDYAEVRLQCRACGGFWDAEQFIPRAIEQDLGFDRYLSHKEGGEAPYVSCPECGALAYVIEERRCALCGEGVEHTCIRCGNEIPPEELDSSPLCGWCAHVMSRDD